MAPINFRHRTVLELPQVVLLGAEDKDEDERTLLAQIRDLLLTQYAPVYYVTYPSTGSYKTVTAGRLEFDFLEGKATLASGQEESMSGSLLACGYSAMRSLEVYSDGEYTLEFDEQGKQKIELNHQVRAINQQFQHVTLDFDAASRVKVRASTHPMSTTEYSKSMMKYKLVSSKFNEAVTADTDIFAADLSPTYYNSIFRISGSFSDPGILYLERTKSSTTVESKLDQTPITAGVEFAYDVVTEHDHTFNLQYSTTCTAYYLAVVEIEGVV